MEEFSFPTTADSSPFASIDSPPLWHLSPAASPDANTTTAVKRNSVLLKQDHDQDDLFPTSGAESGSEKVVVMMGRDQEKEEEKMDLLWEDLNDELLSNHYTPSSRRFYSDDGGGEVMEMGCFQALNISRGNAAVFSVTPTRRPALLVFMKFLRRLFLVHASPPPPPPMLKRPWRRKLP